VIFDELNSLDEIQVVIFMIGKVVAPKPIKKNLFKIEKFLESLMNEAF
jgi:hypothetical protein